VRESKQDREKRRVHAQIIFIRTHTHTSIKSMQWQPARILVHRHFTSYAHPQTTHKHPPTNTHTQPTNTLSPYKYFWWVASIAFYFTSYAHPQTTHKHPPTNTTYEHSVALQVFLVDRIHCILRPHGLSSHPTSQQRRGLRRVFCFFYALWSIFSFKVSTTPRATTGVFFPFISISFPPPPSLSSCRLFPASQ
jgi:hypothetical protein